MKRTPIYLLLLLFGFSAFFSACKPEPCIAPSGTGLKILPLGDSRVEGATPLFESYRYELWKNLIDSSWTFDFVGIRKDEGSYPEYAGQSFDTDHQGLGGEVTSGILEYLDDVLECQGSPDVVLLGIGGNDLVGGETVANAIGNINTIIDQLQTNNANVIVLLEQIAPGTTDFMTPELETSITEFNVQIAEVATTQSTGTSMVVAVNMNEGWTDAYMADAVHYNAAGAKVIADRYFAALNLLLDP